MVPICTITVPSQCGIYASAEVIDVAGVGLSDVKLSGISMNLVALLPSQGVMVFDLKGPQAAMQLTSLSKGDRSGIAVKGNCFLVTTFSPIVFLFLCFSDSPFRR